MPVNPNDKKKRYSYTPDTGPVFAVTLSAEHANMGGFSLAPAGIVNGRPNRFKCRTIYGVTATGDRRTSFICADNATWLGKFSGASFVWDGDTFNVTGRTGEHQSKG